MLHQSCKFGEPKWNPYWVIVLTSSPAINYVPNEHVDIDQYGSFAIPSKIMPWYIYPASLGNQNEIPIELLC